MPRLIEIKLLNFQRHRELIIPVSSGITAIRGDTDTGKTSVMRAVDLLVDNKPSGFLYRHNPKLLDKRAKPLSDKEATLVRFTFDDGSYVERKRDNNKINHYDLNGQIFSTLRGDVPHEITKFLNITDYCIQRQHEPPFLIVDSAGEVAKKLNNLIGLEEIDQITKNINSIVTDLKRESERVERELEENREEYRKYRFLDAAGKLINSVDDNLEKSEELSEKVSDISNLSYIIRESQEEIEGIKEWLEVEPRYEAIMNMILKLKSLLATLETVATMNRDAAAKKLAIDGMKWLDETDGLLKGISLSAEKYKGLESDYQGILTIKYQMLGYKKSIEDSEAIIIEKQDIYEDMIGEVCPFCNQPVDKDKLCCL